MENEASVQLITYERTYEDLYKIVYSSTTLQIPFYHDPYTEQTLSDKEQMHNATHI